MATPADWLAEADEDLETARALIDRRIYKQACFHAQQAVEKALKAVLLRRLGTVPRIHDLPGLLARLRNADPSVPDHGPATQRLDPYYMLARYPDVRPPGAATPDRTEAEEAVRVADVTMIDLKARIA